MEKSKQDIIMGWARLIRDIVLIISIPTFIIFGVKFYNRQIEVLNTHIDLLKETQFDRALSLIKSQKELHKIERDKLENEIANLANLRASEPLEDSTDVTSDFELWYDAGTGALAHERYTKAINYFSNALEKKADALSIAYTHNNIGFANVVLGEFRDAIENYNAAIKSYPQYAIAHGNRASIYYVLGKQEKSFKNCYKAYILYIIKNDYQRALDFSTWVFSLPLKIEDKAIPLYLECVAKKKLNNEDTSECKTVFNENLKKVSTLSWSSDEIESWLKEAKIQKETHTFIEEMIDSLKK